MLWIALHLPRLSLESWLAVLPPEQREQPAALMGAREVLMCNPAAQRLGVRPGLQRVTALALAPHLQLGRIDAARDRQVLTSVAHVALAFTPAVCWAEASGPAAAPGTVLLQVQASLRYFGGLTPLLQRLRAALAPLNCTLQFASAPTAQGAAVLACCAGNGSDELHATDLPQLEGLLGAAPLWLIGTGRAQWAVLDSMGSGHLRRLAPSAAPGLAAPLRPGPAR
jgi:protein ImuB